MGRQKGDPNRSKSRPSSSSTAASLLLNSRTSAVGFGGYVGNSRIEVAGAQVKDHDTEVDGEASLHLRRLSKKDPITRVKALEALGILFKERPANELRQLIPNWIFEYKRLVQDDNQQVREGAHNVMSTLAVAVGREFAPHLRSVMGAWWVSQFDPSREVCGAAQQSFQVAFHGPQKRVEALMFCGSDILAYMDDLLKLSPQTISDKSTPIEEATKKYELVISSALLALAAFLDVILVQKSVSTSAIASVQDGDAIKKNDEKRNEFRDLAAKFCLNHKFFRDYAKSKSSQIRSASYQTLRAFAQNVPAVFNGSNLEIVGGIVLGSFSDKDPSCHAAMWDMVLLVSQKYPQTWDTVSVCKFVLPRLWAFLRHAAYGSAQTSYPCVLPLLRLIPTDTIKPAFGFLKELFVNLWKGHDGCHMGVKDELALLKAVQECFLWTISNAVRYTEKDDVLPEQIQYFMIENVLVKILWNNYAFAGMPLPDSISVGLSANHETGFNAISDVTSADHGSVKEKFTDQFIKHLRTCIIDLLAAIALKSTNLIGAFCTLFQDVCLQMVIYEGRYHLQSSSEGPGCISRISSFFSHLAELLSSNETHNQWLLNQAVRPLVAKLYPVVKSMEYKGSTQLIATIVSMFGPSSFLTLQVIQPAEREGGPDEVEKKIFEDEERLRLAISSFIRNELAPWCLDGNEASSTAKIELLLSIFDDTRFQGDWDLVLAYATNLEEVSNGVISLNIHKVSVLATLVEKLRFKIFGSHRGEEYHECDCQSNRQWNLLRLDGAALAVAGSLSLSHPSCIRLLRFLLGGSDMEFSPPILSKQTTEQVIRLLLQRTLHMLVNSENEWARYAASSVLLPDTVVQLVTAEDARVSTNLSCAAMEALCSSIFCVQNIHNSFEDAAKVVASFYCVYWDHSMRLEKESSGQGDVEGLNDTDDDQSESFMDNQFELDSGIGRLGDSSDKDVSLDVNGSQHDTEEMGANIKALQSILSSGFCKNLSAVMRVIIRQKLAQCIRYAIFDESTESFWMTSLCANWALALIDQLCVDMEETQELLDLLLKPAKSWPFFTAFSCSKADDSFKIVHNQMEHGIKERQHTRFCAFVDRVASVFGWGKVVFGPMWQNMQTNATESQRGNIEVRPVYRVWTLIELLCSWQWPGGKAINSVIPFLESCAVCASGSSEQIVVNCIVNSLFSAALTINYNLEFSNKSWMGLDEEIDDIEDACLRALLVLLKKLSRTDPPHGMIDNAKRFFDMLILDQGFLDDSLLLRSSNILPHILSILVPILRKRRHPSNESIPSNASNIKNGFSLELAVCKWMSLALSAPPLSLCGLSNSEVEHQVWVAVSCFPLHPRFGHIHHFLDDLSHWISKKVAEKVGPYLPEDLVTIMAASSACATPQERVLLLTLLRKQASREAVAAHHANAAEQRALALQNHETTDWRQSYQATLAKLVAASVVYCWKNFEVEDWAFVISHMCNWLEAAVLEAEDFTELVASITKDTGIGMEKESESSTIVTNIGSEITRAQSRQTELTWTAVAIFSRINAVEKLDYMDSSTSVAHLQSSNWSRAKQRAVEDILRIFFASGLAESVAVDSDAGEKAGIIIAVSRVANTHLWENISYIVLNVSDQEKQTAACSVDLWGVGKGAVRALYALLFSSHPIRELQLAAYSLLSSAPLQQSAVIFEQSTLLQDQMEEETLNVGSKQQSSSLLANIRHELAVVLETAPIEILESSLTSPLRVQYFLAWAIFLSHLHSVSVTSAAGEGLVQYVQDSNICSTLLDSLFEHIPLKSGVGSLGRKKKLRGIEQTDTEKVENAARQAAASGSVAFSVEVLWPLEEESVSSLAAALYSLILLVLPACVRVWFTGLRDRSMASAVEAFTTKYCSPQLLADEFAQVQKSAIKDECLTIKANLSTGEITVVYKKEEAGMDMVIRMPKCYPLRAVDVECTRRLGISETRLRKWMLSMAAFLRNQNGAVAEAIKIWKQNVDREFEGVEECPICYSIIHTMNHSLPRLACKTCRHKFHSACLYKWFSTSHKSTCPLCQTPF